MKRFASVLERLLENITIILMRSLAAVVIVAVIYRKLGYSLSWYDEVASIQLAWITYYGAALAALKRKHIGFDGVVLVLPALSRKLAMFIAEFLTIGFFALMTWAGMKVLSVLQGMTLVSLTWMPVTFTQSVIPLGGALFIIASLLSFPMYYRATMAGHSLEHDDLPAES